MKIEFWENKPPPQVKEQKGNLKIEICLKKNKKSPPPAEELRYSPQTATRSRET